MNRIPTSLDFSSIRFSSFSRGRRFVVEDKWRDSAPRGWLSGGKPTVIYYVCSVLDRGKRSSIPRTASSAV